MHMHPPSKLAITWASPRTPAAANPSLKASWLGSLHSSIQSLKCLTCNKNEMATMSTHICVCIWLLYIRYKHVLEVWYKDDLYIKKNMLWLGLTCLVLCNISLDAKNTSYYIHGNNQQTNKYTSYFNHFFLRKEGKWSTISRYISCWD